jgi:hypothetical protein
VEQSSRGPWQGQKQTKERKEIMGISKTKFQLEEISADSFIRERADRLRNEYERKLQECIEDAAIEADMDREMEKHNGDWR